MELEPAEEAIRVNEQQARRLFVIKAHHLDNLMKLLKGGKSVNDFEDTYFGSLDKRRASGYIPEYRQPYFNDVLGSTQEQAEKYARYETEFYNEFLQLPSDYPVKIVEGQKDKICQGCAIGEHCSKRPTVIYDRVDKVYIRAFGKIAKKLNLEDDLTVVDEIVTYNNARPEKVKSILTTAGTVKEVIGSSLSLLDYSVLAKNFRWRIKSR